MYYFVSEFINSVLCLWVVQDVTIVSGPDKVNVWPWDTKELCDLSSLLWTDPPSRDVGSVQYTLSRGGSVAVLGFCESGYATWAYDRENVSRRLWKTEIWNLTFHKLQLESPGFENKPCATLKITIPQVGQLQNLLLKVYTASLAHRDQIMPVQSPSLMGW